MLTGPTYPTSRLLSTTRKSFPLALFGMRGER
jgi:hypothetical protein